MSYQPNIRASGPDFSAFGTLLLDYDPMYESIEAVAELHAWNNNLAQAFKYYRIFDRSGLQNHATTLDAAAAITLEPAGRNGRVGYRFRGGGAYMPPAAFAALTQIEIWAVLQPAAGTAGTGAGFHCLGASANNVQATEYVTAGNEIKDDTLSNTLQTVALATPQTDIHLLQITGNGNVGIYYDGVLAGGGLGALVVPTLPVIGAGRSTAGAPLNSFNGVILRYIAFSVVLSAAARTAGAAAMKAFYGTP